jgi:hypothetical protein
MRRIFAGLALLASCATPQGRPAAAAPPPAPVADDPLLFEYVPESAQAVVLLRRSAVAPLARYLEEDPAMRDELRAFLQDRLGTDVLGVDGLVAFATGLGPHPEVALLLHLREPPAGALKGTPAGDHLGIPLISLGAPDGAPLLAALVPAGVVLGTEGAVKAEIALSREQVAPGRGRGPLSALRVEELRDTPFIAALDPTHISDPKTMLVVEGYGARNLTLFYRRPDLVRLTIAGDAVKLTRAGDLLQQLVTRAIQEAEQQKNNLIGGSEALVGAGAIVGYHASRRALEQIRPKMVNGALVSEYHLPAFTSEAALVPIAGVLAAVAIPAFMKHLRRSKTTEATSSLRRLQMAVAAWHADHKKDGKRFAFPPSISWTPARACCPQPEGRCGAADFSAWKALDFSLEAPLRYQYRFTSEGRGARARFIAEARGDLDCDGKFSSFQIAGHLDDSLDLVVEPLQVRDEIE